MAEHRSSETPWLLRWWPVIVFLIVSAASSAAGYWSVRIEMAGGRERIAAVEAALKTHEDRQREERAEVLAELRELRGDVKVLLQRLPLAKGQ